MISVPPTSRHRYTYRDALSKAAAQPFRMVPYFDPGVWGGDWMKTHFDLPDNGSNYAWSFDGVPEENSLLLDFGSCVVETPALNLVYSHPRELLGDRVHARFGKEFPIRFDMLDTMHGQNLSLQVHPLTEYIQSHFHMHYTQDESYYLLDAAGEAPCVYLGIKTGTKPEEMIDALQTAQNGGKPFPAEKFVNRIPVKKHDHVLIPAGTVHCSGADTMVLEISATPYIFTFKLWDWGRVDLDGKPRPIHLEHGAANIQWYRNTEWVHRNLVNAVAEVYTGENGTVVRTGLHEREFLDTLCGQALQGCRPPLAACKPSRPGCRSTLSGAGRNRAGQLDAVCRAYMGTFFHHALHNGKHRQHQFQPVGHRDLCQCKTDKQLEGVFRLFDLDKAAAGFHNAHSKKQHEQPIANCLQRAVDAGHYTPNLSAFEGLRAFGQQRPYFCQLVVPCGECGV